MAGRRNKINREKQTESEKIVISRSKHFLKISFDYIKIFGIIVPVIVSIFTIPILLDRYIYSPHLLYKVQEPQIVGKDYQLILGVLNNGSKTANNIRLVVMTPNKETTCSPQLNVYSNISKGDGWIAVDIPALRVNQPLNFSFHVPDSLARVKSNSSLHYGFTLMSITAENTAPIKDQSIFEDYFVKPLDNDAAVLMEFPH